MHLYDKINARINFDFMFYEPTFTTDSKSTKTFLIKTKKKHIYLTDTYFFHFQTVWNSASNLFKLNFLSWCFDVETKKKLKGTKVNYTVCCLKIDVDDKVRLAKICAIRMFWLLLKQRRSSRLKKKNKKNIQKKGAKSIHLRVIGIKVQNTTQKHRDPNKSEGNANNTHTHTQTSENKWLNVPL